MECNWTIDDLFKAQKQLRHLLRNERNQNKKNYIRLLIDKVKLLIEEEQELANPPLANDNEETDYDEVLSLISKELFSERDYYSLINVFTSITDQFYPQIEDIEDILSQRIGPDEDFSKITGATISNNRALSLTNQFYAQYFPNLYPTFHQAYQNRHTSIKYADLGDKTIATSTYIDLVNRYFITMSQTDDLAKFYDFVHEYGHVISYIINPQAFYLSPEHHFDEVASIFPELLAQYENFGHFNNSQVLFELYRTLTTYMNKADALMCHAPIINAYREHNYQYGEAFLQSLKDNYEIDEEDFEDALNTVPYDEGSYIISYMVAIELFHIYKQDKKKALKIFQRILEIPYNQSIMSYIEKEFKLGSHLEEETATFLDTFKLELKRSGEFHV